MRLKKIDFCELIDKAIRVFLYILIFWLPYSQAVIESCVVVGLVLFVVKRVYMLKINSFCGIKVMIKTINPLDSFMNMGILVFMLIGLISVINSPIYEIAFHGLVSKVLEWFIIYFLILEVFNKKKYLMLALTVLIITAFSTVLDSFWQYYFTQKDIFFGHTLGAGLRATAAFKTPNGLAAYLTLFVPIAISFVFYAKRKIIKVLFLLISFLSMWSLMITFSRGGFLGILVGLFFFVYFWILQRKVVKRKYKIIMIVAVLLVCLLSIYILMNSHVVDLLNRKGTAESRISIWVESMQLVKDRPVFGHGINTYMRIFQAYRRVPSSSPTFAHNCYIQMAMEVGILGLVAFLFIIFKLFYEFFKKQKLLFFTSGNLRVVSFGILSGIVAFLTHSFFDNNLYSLQLSSFLWYLIGIYVCSLKVENNLD